MLVFHARKETLINAAPQVVFDLIGDISRHDALAGSGEVLRIRKVTEGPVGVGTQFEADEDIPFGGHHQRFVATSTVVTYDPPHRISWTSVPPLKPQPRCIQWWFRLAPEADGIRVVHEVEVDLGGPVNILLKLPYRMIRGGRIAAGMEKTLANLRRLAEERVFSAGSGMTISL